MLLYTTEPTMASVLLVSAPPAAMPEMLDSVSASSVSDGAEAMVAPSTKARVLAPIVFSE